ncbi:MAG: DUF1836 domain-containing protein [Lactobacillaceae bacterium]|nr:DUF1836 domain-containing protein [Lactobacillaceae bacterium]
MEQARELVLQMPRYAELPTMGLYLEQVTDYLNEQLSPLEDVRLTSAMVSNYVKHHLVDRPVKKLYGQEQLADLAFIAVAKNILPLADLRVAVRIQQNSRFNRIDAYDYFCQELEAAVQTAFTGQALPSPTVRTDQQKMLHHLALAIAYKASVDRFFATTCDL